MLSAHLTCIPGASRLRSTPKGPPRYQGPSKISAKGRTYEVQPGSEPSEGACVVCGNPITVAWTMVGVEEVKS